MSSTNSRSWANKGQTGQVFIFLVAVIVIIATIVLAGKLIGGLTGTACDASLVDFQNNFRQHLDANSAYGSRNAVSLESPCDTTQLCFVDARIIQEGLPFSSDTPTIDIGVREGVEENVFLETEDGFQASYDERILLSSPTSNVPETDFCIDAQNGRFEFRTEGYGRYIQIS